MSTPSAEMVNALGKELPPVDTRSAEEVDTRDPFNAAKMNEMLADPDALANLSESEIAAKMGMGEYDRSVEIAPAGDATVHELARRAEAPAAAAAPVAAAPVAAAPAAAPAAAAAAPTATESAAAEAAVAAAAGGKPAPTAEPVVETRDGRPVIKYAVLQAARRENSDLKAEIARLSAGRPAQDPAALAPITDDVPDAQIIEISEKDATLLTAEEIAGLREKYPDEIVDRWVSDNKLAVAAYQNTLQDRQDRENVAVATSKQNTIDFIDVHPVASTWFAGETPEDQALAQEAIAQDRVLRELPEWKNAPDRWQERMEKAITNVALIHGIAYKPGTPGTTPAPQLSLQERAQAALAAAAAAPKLPSSHSDLPAGAPAGQSEVDVVAGMSATQLEAKLENMKNPADIEKYLASVA